MGGLVAHFRKFGGEMQFDGDIAAKDVRKALLL
jgi:hypothetical protein